MIEIKKLPTIFARDRIVVQIKIIEKSIALSFPDKFFISVPE